MSINSSSESSPIYSSPRGFDSDTELNALLAALEADTPPPETGPTLQGKPTSEHVDDYSYHARRIAELNGEIQPRVAGPASACEPLPEHQESGDESDDEGADIAAASSSDDDTILAGMSTLSQEQLAQLEISDDEAPPSPPQKIWDAGDYITCMLHKLIHEKRPIPLFLRHHFKEGQLDEQGVCQVSFPLQDRGIPIRVRMTLDNCIQESEMIPFYHRNYFKPEELDADGRVILTLPLKPLALDDSPEAGARTDIGRIDSGPLHIPVYRLLAEVLQTPPTTPPQDHGIAQAQATFAARVMHQTPLLVQQARTGILNWLNPRPPLTWQELNEEPPPKPPTGSLSQTQ